MVRILFLTSLILVAACSERRGVGVAGGGSWGSSGGSGSMMALSIPIGP
ncbi:hypothetical protein E9232_004773 [Inquilinus ginsengisoli]|jgi:hypothetical protein|uniref:Lipoprotein n=1 Tax=Inquilinus ginsengisoli TaxID=363840 RepID=A0ABU1JUD8_9PROT|nr:hypothetical protein [Inquilinus ginsengisoli]MDR6292235.1 hypothetical protein [Inquilinus ginsengisoli]